MTRRAALTGGAILAAPSLAKAQGFPTRPVRLIVPIAPGGANDIIARLIAERLAPILGQPVIVENRPGAGGNLGAQAVAQAEKDGHTLLFTSANVLTANKYLYGNQMPIEPMRDLAPVTRVAIGTILLVVNSQRPYRTFEELVAFARANPGRVTMGSSGTGTISHLFLEKLNRAAGIEITHVPYRGGALAIQDLASGTIDMMFDAIPALLPNIREGRFRPLVAGSAQRITYVPELANVPGMDEALPGKGFDALNWWSVVAPAGTPPAAVNVLHAGLVRVMSDGALGTRLREMSFLPTTDPTPEAFGAFWRSQDAVWRDLVVQSGATAQ
ncbi:tripartite tricarboxylate transporter substrate binding protein [Roseomonas terrae]|uniref:Tripartite tricarboxylate transporter substrate binding protein n=2 Tax=Neoroseomonas terrae TaxID=424799 RepID=A0ABS5EEK3_9PROT|nr:tripartite tricarboxylate transporter substrate binding protein [Neoroseomonas terrae]